jgi:hypothetical protein
MESRRAYWLDGQKSRQTQENGIKRATCQVPSVPSGVIRIAPAILGFREETLKTGGILNHT